MEKIVCKFGGTSVADGNAAKRVQAIIKSNEARRYIVVSAPGKRFEGDTKITDILYAAAGAAKENRSGDFKRAFGEVRGRFLSLARETAADGRFLNGLKAELDGIEEKIFRGADEAYAASRGEYLSAKIFAYLLGMPFADAEETIRFSPDGRLDEKTYEIVRGRLCGMKRAVIPGFYGADAQGGIHTFPRGGGDITGAVIARGVRADLYENWTDVSGVFADNPKTQPRTAALPFLTYAEFAARFRWESGAGVLHGEAAEIACGAGIPIRVLNTFRPEDAGTTIAFVPTEIQKNTKLRL